MGTVYLVRHGQASFGAADYDQLSELGARQCRALGEWFARRGLVFDAVLRGSLKRHVQSLAAIEQGLPGLPAALEWPGLNEYDSHALLQTVHDGPLAQPTDPEQVRAHFRLLRLALQGWIEGRTQPSGMPGWPDFVAGVTGALDHVRRHHRGDVLIVSSGGPISTAVTQVLGAPHAAMIDLNLRIRNSSITELAYTPKRHMLQAYNHLPHLEHPDRAGWVTYS